MRKSYIYDHAFYSGNAVLVLNRGEEDENSIGMQRNNEYRFNCEPGESYEVFKAGQVGNTDAWLGGGDVADLPDA